MKQWTMPPGVPRPPIRRCEAMAKKGTGTGICDHVLSLHGDCPNSSNHTDEFEGERQPL